MDKHSNWFTRSARAASKFTGRPLCFMLASATIVAWLISGPLFGFSDTWQLIINTGTTIITFLMVFLIQNSQNRDSRVMALKLDELLRGVEGARTGFVDLEEMSDAALEQVQKEFARLREQYAPLVEDDLAHVERELKSRRKGR